MSGLNCSSSKRGVTHKVGAPEDNEQKAQTSSDVKATNLPKTFYLHRRYIETTGNGIAARRTNADSSPRKSRHVRAILERAGTAARRCARFCARRMRCRSARLRGPPRRSSRIVLARAARTLDPIDDGRPVRRGRLIRRVGPNVRAPGHARAPTTLAPSASSTATLAGTRPRGGGGGRARAPRRNVRGPGLRVTSRPPRSRGFPPASSTRDAPPCDASRDPQAVPRAPAHRVRANDRIRRRRRRRPRAAARHSRPSPDPRSRRGGARQNAPISRRRRAPPIANSRGLKPPALPPPPRRRRRRRNAVSPSKRSKPRVAPSWTPPTRARRTSSTTPPHPPPPASSSSPRSARCGDPRADPFVAAAIRNIVEGRAATKTVYAVRWDDPLAKPEGPDGLPATVAFKEFRGTVRDLKQAIADANGLRCGHTDVSHVAELEPNLRFLRPLRTEDDLHALPDHAWVLWSAAKAEVDGERGEGCELRSDEEENNYRFPAILPPQPPSRARGSAFGRAR